METVTEFIFLGYNITTDGDYSHEIKRHLPFGRKVMTNLNSIKKQRQYFANKGPSSQSYVFSTVKYGCIQGAVAAWAQEGREELPQVEGQEGRP